MQKHVKTTGLVEGTSWTKTHKENRQTPEEQKTNDTFEEGKSLEQETQSLWQRIKNAIFGKGKDGHLINTTEDLGDDSNIVALYDESDIPEIKNVSQEIITEEEKSKSSIKRVASFITKDIPGVIKEGLSSLASSVKALFAKPDKYATPYEKKNDAHNYDQSGWKENSTYEGQTKQHDNSHWIGDNASTAAPMSEEDIAALTTESAKSLIDPYSCFDPKQQQQTQAVINELKTELNNSNEAADQSQETAKQGKKGTEAPGKHSQQVLVDRGDGKNEGPAVGA